MCRKGWFPIFKAVECDAGADSIIFLTCLRYQGYAQELLPHTLRCNADSWSSEIKSKGQRLQWTQKTVNIYWPKYIYYYI